MARRCKLCNDALAPMKRLPVCQTCRRVGGWGMFIGGVIVGLVGGILKLKGLL
jgi:hypothetical protein